MAEILVSGMASALANGLKATPGVDAPVLYRTFVGGPGKTASGKARARPR